MSKSGIQRVVDTGHSGESDEGCVDLDGESISPGGATIRAAIRHCWIIVFIVPTGDADIIGIRGGGREE